MQKTKEQLNKEIVILETENKSLKDDRDFYKMEFAKVFGWYKPKSNRGFGGFEELSDDPIIPTWARIFTKVGELLYIAREKKFVDMNFDIDRRLKNVEELVLPEEQDRSL